VLEVIYAHWSFYDLATIKKLVWYASEDQITVEPET